MLLKFVHDIHGSNYILCPALRENFGLNLRARISSVRKTLKSKFHKLIAKYISVSPVDYDTPRRIPHAKVDTFASYVRIFLRNPTRACALRIRKLILIIDSHSARAT